MTRPLLEPPPELTLAVAHGTWGDTPLLVLDVTTDAALLDPTVHRLTGPGGDVAYARKALDAAARHDRDERYAREGPIGGTCHTVLTDRDPDRFHLWASVPAPAPVPLPMSPPRHEPLALTMPTIGVGMATLNVARARVCPSLIGASPIRFAGTFWHLLTFTPLLDPVTGFTHTITWTPPTDQPARPPTAT